MGGNDTLLRALVADAFKEPQQEKTAAVQPAPQVPTKAQGQVKIATGLTSTQFVKKLASAVEFIAGGLEKQAIGEQWGEGPGLAAEAFSTESDILGGDQALREVAGVPSGYLPDDVLSQGTDIVPGETPGFVGPTSTPLAAAGSDTDEGQPGGFSDTAGIDYASLMGPGRGTSKTAAAKLRAKMAMDRVLGKAKSAVIKRAQQADASIPPSETIGEPLAPPSGTEETGSFAPESPTLASEALQSTDTVMALTNQDVDEGNKPTLENALGSEAVSNADADATQEEILEGASGDGDSGPTEKEALASILNADVLTRIAQGG